MRLIRARLLAAAIAVLVTATACGDDSTGVSGYVAATAAITEQMTRDAFANLPPGAAPTRDQVAAVVAVRRTAFEAVGALDPPAEMAPEHQALLVALGRFVTAGEEFLADSAGLDAPEFLAALEATTHIDAIADDVSVACTAWETRAADLGTPVELGC